MFLNYLEQKFEKVGILKDCVLKIILAKSKFSFIKHLKKFFAVDEYLLFPPGEYLSFPLTPIQNQVHSPISSPKSAPANIHSPTSWCKNMMKIYAILTILIGMCTHLSAFSIRVLNSQTQQPAQGAEVVIQFWAGGSEIQPSEITNKSGWVYFDPKTISINNHMEFDGKIRGISVSKYGYREYQDFLSKEDNVPPGQYQKGWRVRGQQRYGGYSDEDVVYIFLISSNSNGASYAALNDNDYDGDSIPDRSDQDDDNDGLKDWEDPYQFNQIQRKKPSDYGYSYIGSRSNKRNAITKKQIRERYSARRAERIWFPYKKKYLEVYKIQFYHKVDQDMGPNYILKFISPKRSYSLMGFNSEYNPDLGEPFLIVDMREENYNKYRKEAVARSKGKGFIDQMRAIINSLPGKNTIPLSTISTIRPVYNKYGFEEGYDIIFQDGTKRRYRIFWAVNELFLSLYHPDFLENPRKVEKDSFVYESSSFALIIRNCLNANFK